MTKVRQSLSLGKMKEEGLDQDSQRMAPIQYASGQVIGDANVELNIPMTGGVTCESPSALIYRTGLQSIAR